ncbi:MAG: hypothetical protein AAGA75_09110 [Cyanobacteria bacterium P01_E01_bin.6]
MDFKAALEAIKGLENGAELAAAIQSETQRLEAKSFEVIGEKRSETQKRQAMSDALGAIAKSLGVEGEIDTLLEKLPGQIQELKTGRDKLQTDFDKTSGEYQTLQSKVKGFEQKQKFTDIATKANASAPVLEKLFGDRADELKVAEDGSVTIGDKPLKEYVEGDDNLKLFMPALFPSAQQGTPKGTPPSLPKGSPKGDDPKTDPVKSYMGNQYGGFNKLVGNPNS